MSPAGDKPKKSEPQQAVIQSGTVGFYPLNSLAFTALKHEQAHCLIGLKEESAAEKLRNQSEFVIGKETLPIQGKVFAGICDAFYRGKLPELLIVTSNMLDVPVFIEEFMDFLEKLCSLGFLTIPEVEDIATLDRYIPQVVIASYGVVYEVILQKLADSVESLGSISDRQKDRLLQKFSRAVFTCPGEGYDLQLMPYTVFQKPLSLNLAGSKSMYTVKTNQMLENLKIASHFNPNGEQGVLEWELNLAYRHLTHRILPLLHEAGSAKDLNDQSMSDLFDTLGQKLGILPGLVTIADKKPAFAKDAKPALSNLDLAMLHQVKVLAQRCNHDEMILVLNSLLDTLKPLVNPHAQPVSSEKH